MERIEYETDVIKEVNKYFISKKGAVFDSPLDILIINVKSNF